MILNLKRCISLLLVLMLLIGIVPTAGAAETDSTLPAETEETETTEPTKATDPTQPTEPTEGPDPTEPTEPTEGPDPTEPTEPTEPPGDDPAETDTGTAADVGLFSIGSTQKNIMLFDYVDNGNYTTYLSSQVTIRYRVNGTGSSKTAYLKNLGWHFARYGGVAYPDDPLYCIEPCKNYGASTSGNSVDRDVTFSGSGATTGSNAWYGMPDYYREFIGLVLLYSGQMWDDSISVTTTKKADNPNVPLRIATQFLIYEIVCGMRQEGTFARQSSSGGTSGDVLYNAGVNNVDGFASNYNSLVSKVQGALKIPSFTSASSGSSPTITLTGNSTTVTDSNGVLGNFSFPNGNGARFSKSGNTLTITQTGDISESTVFKASRSIPSAADSTYSIWYMSGSSYQTTISLASASTGTLNGYFKLKAPAKAGISLTKTTEDGKNLTGWQFGIYSNSTCTSLVSGPHTTDSGGKISVSGLTAGTYYVKELGHTDSAINAQYTCVSTNPQKVTLTAGQTASVSFHNKRNTGNVKLVKTTNTGENLGGWQVGLYYDEACANEIPGSPFTTGEDGTITVSDLQPGTLYARELPSDDPYWVCDTEVKAVQVVVNQTAEVTFSNTHRGRCKIIKTMPDGGSLAGWMFEVRTADGELAGSFTTGEDGTILTDYLLPGEYTVKEILPEGSPYICDQPNPKTVTVQAGQTAEITFTNRLKPGEIMIQKVDTRGEPLAGAEFLLEWSVDGTSWKPVIFTDSQDVKEGICTTEGLTDGKLTGGADGIVRFTGLHPQRLYRLTETKAPEGYQLLTKPVHEGGIQVEDEYFVQLTVVNAPAYELPMTGSTGSTVSRMLQIGGALALLTLLLRFAKKRW